MTLPHPNSAMMNTKRNRGGRMNSGRPDKRQMYPDRQQRPRGQQIDKSIHIEGVYRNQRFSHAMFSLIGTTVQAQVKNGNVYEGILRTISQKGDFVLEMVHLLEDGAAIGNIGSSTPSRESIIDKLIIKITDLITINAANVDLDYAVRDAFTDTGISKYNGEMKDKEMRELQPWDSEGADDLGGLEGDRSNGWDAHEMFQTNANMFNVKSSYDESLGQYTTKLNRELTTEEWRRREEEATRLANEIERSEQYKKHIALENGEGDDEEEAFSSVVRPDNSHPHTANTGGSGKYIPPNKRNTGAPGMNKQGGRGYPHPHQQGGPPHQQQQQQQQGQQPPMGSRSMSSHRQSPPVSHTPNSQSTIDTLNGDKSGRPSIPASTAGPTIKTSSPVQQDSERGGPIGDNKQEPNPQQYPPANKSETGAKKSLKGRDEQIKELKEFSSKFKLDDNKETKDKDKDKDKTSDNNKEAASVHVHEEKDQERQVMADTSLSLSSSDKISKTEDKANEVESSHDKPADPEPKKEIPTIKSKLNPNADVFTPKSFPQKQTQQQIPTPPRPQTQSPIIQQAPILPQSVYPTPGQSYIMPPNTAMVLNNQPTPQPQQVYNVRPKRAVVSVKPDYTASAVQAATGQPLLAQSAQPYMYIPSQMVPQPTGYQMGQVGNQQMMPMPPAQTAPRGFMTPTSMQGMPPTSLQGSGLDQNTPPGQGGQMYSKYMTPHQQGPMPAHINPASHLSHANHMNHITMSTNTQQNSQINPPPLSVSGHHHPAPSPVLTNNPNQQPMNSGPHPPSSGTPQPPQGYPQATLQAPPLQASPHNPTSPQNMQMPYPYNTSHPLQMQSSAGGGGGGGGQQFSMPQQSSGQSSVTYSMHSHQTPHMQPQIVMMPPQMSASGQLNHPHHIHGSHQFQGHPMAGPGTMPQQMISQSGVQGLHTQTPGQGPHPQHQMQHFLPQVHNAGGQPVQNYQPSQ